MVVSIPKLALGLSIHSNYLQRPITAIMSSNPDVSRTLTSCRPLQGFWPDFINEKVVDYCTQQFPFPEVIRVRNATLKSLTKSLIWPCHQVVLDRLFVTQNTQNPSHRDLGQIDMESSVASLT